MFNLLIFRFPVELLTALLMMCVVCVADSSADTLKCVDSKGKISYTNAHCPGDTRIEKRISDSNATASVSPRPVPLDTDKSDRYMPRFTSPSSRAITSTDQLRQTEVTETHEARESERIEQEESLREIVEQAREDAGLRAREIAEQAADDLRNEMLRSSIRTKNGMYLSVLLLGIIGFDIYLIARHNKEKSMDENEKYGVVAMIISFFLILLALMISNGWTPQLDYVENLMNFLTIELIFINNEYGGGSYLISVKTKYVVLSFLSLSAYGFTTYLGITPIFKPWTLDWLKGQGLRTRLS